LSIPIFDWEEVVVEGKARIIVPRMELYVREDGVYEPAWAPVFYNPLARAGRDLTVLATRVFFGSREFFFIDALAGSGVRGIRLALESYGYGVVNDVDPLAYYTMQRNIVLNSVEDRVKPYFCEANTLLNNYTFSSQVVDFIDVDPYGSPIPFIDSAVKPLGKKSLLGVTATDLAPLSCTHPHKTLRRYNTECNRVDFEKELGLRIMIYNIVFRAASQDVALMPILSFYHKYYFRVFFKAERSGSTAYRVLRDCRGYLWYCPTTLERGFTASLNELESKLCLDRSKPVVFGPIWRCKLGDPEFAEKIVDEASRDKDAISVESVSIARILVDEYNILNPYIRYDKLFGLLKKSQPPLTEFIEFLRDHGFKACRTHFDPRGVRTDADIVSLMELLK